MIDLKKVREHLEEYKQVCINKNVDIDVDNILNLDEQRKVLQQDIDAKKNEQKLAGKSGDYEKAKTMKVEIQNLEEQYTAVVEELHALNLKMPDFVHPDVPIGKSEDDNVVTETWGEIPDFDFEIKDHVELMEGLDMLDVKRGVKLAGARSYFLKGAGALLENAVLQYTFEKIVNKWYQVLSVPNIVNYEAFRGTGYFPGGEEDAYQLERDEKWLIATAEIPLAGYHSDELLTEEELPKKYVAMSPCYRREAGTYGKDTRGLYRIHQFQKVEQVVIIPADEKMLNQFHQEILYNAKQILEDLNIPHRVLHLCTWDLAIGKYNSHDLECWMPSRNSYGETHSATSFLEFQSRRLNLRYKDSEGNNKYCYTLNCTAIASPRILIPLIENNQTADGKIKIPEVLRKYFGGKEIIG